MRTANITTYPSSSERSIKLILCKRPKSARYNYNASLFSIWPISSPDAESDTYIVMHTGALMSDLHIAQLEKTTRIYMWSKPQV